MPTSMMNKVNSVCGIPMDKLENMWAHAKHQAGGGANPAYGIVMTIFKKKLPQSCIKKLGWNSNPIHEANNTGFIGVDFDGTLSHYEGYKNGGELGKPIQPILDKVKQALDSGIRVKIFTARASKKQDRERIKSWCKKYIGQELPVTNIKEPAMIAQFDDRAVQVEKNTGKILGDPNKIQGYPKL